MRKLATHLAGDEIYPLQIVAADESGVGRPCHRYEISGFCPETAGSVFGGTVDSQVQHGKTTILFQKGVVSEAQGVTVQALLRTINAQLMDPRTGQTYAALAPEVTAKLQQAIDLLDKRDRRAAAQALESRRQVSSVGVPAYH